MLVQYNTKTIQVKIVYYGPAMSGKTTMLRSLSKKFNKVQDLTSIETTTGRTLFFDFGSLNFKGSDWNIKILMYTATGQDFYASTRPSKLHGTDGLIFVMDSNPELIEDNKQSWAELKKFFSNKIFDIPIVICLNKRDLPNFISRERIMEFVESEFFSKIEVKETIATEGKGVAESFSSLLNFVFPGIKILN